MAGNQHKKYSGLFIAATALFILQCLAFLVIVFSIVETNRHGGWNLLGGFLPLLIVIPAIICLILALILILKGQAKIPAIIYSLLSIIMIDPLLPYPIAESFSRIPLFLILVFIATGVIIVFIMKHDFSKR